MRRHQKTVHAQWQYDAPCIADMTVCCYLLKIEHKSYYYYTTASPICQGVHGKNHDRILSNQGCHDDCPAAPDHTSAKPSQKQSQKMPFPPTSLTGHTVFVDNAIGFLQQRALLTRTFFAFPPQHKIGCFKNAFIPSLHNDHLPLTSFDHTAASVRLFCPYVCQIQGLSFIFFHAFKIPFPF